MANIAPQSELRLFKNVPLDKGYKRGVYLGNEVGCTNTFINQQLMVQNRHMYTLTHYTYLREGGNIIRVGMAVDDLWDVNYLCYRNPTIGSSAQDKWFFGFVDRVEYVNNEVTDIYFTEDILTTWWEEATLGECFVERMHEYGDSLGKNLTPENAGIGDYKYALRYPGAGATAHVVRSQLFDLRPTWTVFCVACATLGPDDEDYFSGTVARCYDDVITGYKLFAFDTDELQDGSSGESDRLKYFLSHYPKLYKDEGLLGIFILPKALLDSSDVDDPAEPWWSPDINYPQIVNHADETHAKLFNGYALTGDTTLDGYLPANFKMYTAPYCVCQFTTPDGQEMILRHEYMESRTSGSGFSFSVDTQFKCLYSVFPPYVLTFRPFDGYASLTANDYGDESSIQISFKDLPQGSWTHGLFQQFARDVIAPMLVDSSFIVAGLAGSLNSVRQISPMIKTTEGKKTLIGNAKTSYHQMWKQTVKTDYGVGSSNSGQIHAIREIQHSMGESYSKAMQPQITQGVTQAPGAYASRCASFETKCRCVNRQDAERIDRYFSAYGYAQYKIMQPYRCVRQHWTYLKTSNCLITGNLPSELCYEISEIYNNGITFWRYLSEINHYDFTRGGNPDMDTPLI